MKKIKKEVKKKVMKHKAKESKRECISCHRQIKDGEHYFMVREFNNKEQKNVPDKFVHKNCQDIYDDDIKGAITGSLFSSAAEMAGKMLNEGMVLN